MSSDSSPDQVFRIVALLHVLSACVWLSGPFTLVVAVLPRALRDREPQRVRDFERGYGRVGLVAFGLLAISGLWLASRVIPDWSAMLSGPNPAGKLVALKLGLLVVTAAAVSYGKGQVLPHLTADRMRPFAIHAWVMALLGTLMVVVGVALRFTPPA